MNVKWMLNVVFVVTLLMNNNIIIISYLIILSLQMKLMRMKFISHQKKTYRHLSFCLEITKLFLSIVINITTSLFNSFWYIEEEFYF